MIDTYTSARCRVRETIADALENDDGEESRLVCKNATAVSRLLIDNNQRMVMLRQQRRRRISKQINVHERHPRTQVADSVGS